MLIQALSPLGGVEVQGVDLSRPLPADVSRQLADLYEEHGLVAIRGQQLTKLQLIGATEPFGGSDIPAVNDSEPEAPGVTIITTRKPDGSFEPGEDDVLVGQINWHTDQAYITRPNRGKLLYALEVPPEGGMTGFIDGSKTYAALPATTKARIDGLHVIQSWRHAQATIHKNRVYRREGETVLADNRFPDVAYPLVVSHPNSGRKSLNIPPLWASGILELPRKEGLALIEELIAHISQPQFAYWHRYSPGDVVAWDNWRFMHAASGTPPGQARTLWSVIIRGGPEIGRQLQAA
jgi:taurine dioxygenase